jgi:hypothetical protein
MLIVRFTVLVLATVAAIVGVALADTWWSVVLATLVTLALLAQTVILIFHFLSASDNRPAAEEEVLEDAALVEAETGLPTRRRWNEHAARVYAERRAERGALPVPAAWRGPDAPRRILLVATAPIDARRFIDEALDGHDPRDVGVLVIVPTLARRRLHLALGDASEALPHAEAVLNETLEALRETGMQATGHIGAADPAVAVSEGLRTYDADLVVVARRLSGRLRHLEDVPVDVAAATFGRPLREIDLSVSPTAEPEARRSLATAVP